MSKRKYTRSIFRALFAQGTGIDVCYIYNKSQGCLEDVIGVRIIGVETDTAFNCRLDEAIILAAGLNKVVGQMLVGQLPIPADTVEFINDWNKEKQD